MVQTLTSGFGAIEPLYIPGGRKEERLIRQQARQFAAVLTAKTNEITDAGDFLGAHCRAGRQNHDSFGQSLRFGKQQAGVWKIGTVGFHAMASWVEVTPGKN